MNRNYQKEYQKKRVYVVVCNCEVIGVWGNLKNLCEEMKEKDPEFYSYSTLSKKKKNENPIKFQTNDDKNYLIKIERVRRQLKVKSKKKPPPTDGDT